MPWPVLRSDSKVLDVRPDDEWSGKANDFRNKRTGHIPGAVHLFAQTFLTDDERRTVRPATELRTLLKDAGVQPGWPRFGHDARFRKESV